VVQDDPKLSNDSEGVPKPNGVAGGSISDRGIISLLDGKLTRWSNASRVPKKKTKGLCMLGDSRKELGREGGGQY
jgi:hypothetical protein